MARPSPGQVDDQIGGLIAALAKMNVDDGGLVEFTSASRGRYFFERESSERSATCVRKASPSSSLDVKKLKTGAIFDFTPPCGSPVYPPWAMGRKRTLVTKGNNSSRPNRRSATMAAPIQTAPQPSHLSELPRSPLGPRDGLLCLLTLPPEIRNLIYSFVIGTGGQHEAQLRKVFIFRHARHGSREIIRRFPIQPSICLVSQQLRDEVLSMFYGGKVLEFKHSRKSDQNGLIANMSDPGSIVRYSRGWSAARYLTKLSIKFSPEFSSQVYDLVRMRGEQTRISVRPGHLCVCVKPCLTNTIIVTTTDVTSRESPSTGLVDLAAGIAAWRQTLSDEAVLQKLQE